MDNSTSDADKSPVSKPEIDHSPKALTLKAQLLFGLKLAAFAAIFFFLIWFCEH